MSRLFQPIPANPTFGVLQKNGYASDYTEKKKLKEVFSDSIRNQRRSNLSQSQLLKLKNCELKKNIIYNQVYLDKTNLIAGLFSNENLEGITTLCTRGEVDPETNLPSCLQEVTTIDPSAQPFYIHYTIDPTGALFGNTQCGLNNFTNYMQINVPIIGSNTSLQGCIPQCNSRADDVCALVCANPDVINNVIYPYQLGSPWPHFGGLYNNNSRLSPYLGPQTANVKWVFDKGNASAIESTPIIGRDGTIYFGSQDFYFYALYSNGTLKWTYQTTGQINSSAAIGSDGTIYFGSRDSYFYALNPDGTFKWKYLTGNVITSSPAIGSDGTIYIGSNGIYAINPNGIIKWFFPTNGFLQASPAIGSDGTIYISQQGWWFYALNPNGSEKWVNGEVYGNGSSPTIGLDGTLYVGSVDKKLYALN